MFTYNQVNSTRMWMPCIDNMNERCMWEMEYTVSYENSVASTGDLICPPEIDDHSKTKRFYYQSDIPISAPNVFFAVGNFCIVPDPAFPEKITYFCLPGRDIFLPSTVGIMRTVCNFYIKFTKQLLILYKIYKKKVFEFFENYLNVRLPFRHYKQVYIENPYSKIESGAGITLLSTHLLHSHDIIDQVYSTRRILALALALQWFGVNMTFKSYPDIWIIFGIAGYLSYLFCKKIFGTNYFKSMIMKVSKKNKSR